MPPTVFATAADAVEAAKQVAAKDSEHAQTERQLERALQLRREEESSGERSDRPGRVEVGKLAGRAGNAATTAAPEGCADVRADRGSWIGNRFEMPLRRHGQGQDERYREHVVAATAHLLAELEAHGRADIGSIAARGPDGRGWRVGGERVALPLNRGLQLADPDGRRLWWEVEWLGGYCAAGADQRLMCPCRSPRRRRPNGRPRLRCGSPWRLPPVQKYRHRRVPTSPQ